MDLQEFGNHVFFFLNCVLYVQKLDIYISPKHMKKITFFKTCEYILHFFLCEETYTLNYTSVKTTFS